MDLHYASKVGAPTSSVWDVSKARGSAPVVSFVNGPHTVLAVQAPGAPGSQEHTISSSSSSSSSNTDAAATALAWHPALPLLALGWGDGSLSLWDAGSKRHLEQPKEHRCAVTHLIWFADGSRLATVDASAKAIIWAADKAGRWRPLANAEPPSIGLRVTHATWDCQPMSTAGSSTRPAALLYAVSSADTPGSSAVRWLDEGGSSGVLQDLGEPLAALLPYAERDQLVVVSVSGHALVLARPADGMGPPNRGSVGGAFTWTVQLRMVLAKAAENASILVCWAGRHTVASVVQHQASAVRLFDLETQDNTLLPLEGMQGSGVACLAWSDTHQQLAVAASNGALHVFKRRPASCLEVEAGEDGTGGSQWQQQYMVQVEGVPSALAWGPGPQHLLAFSGGQLLLTSKQRLLHKVAGSNLALQVAPQEVLVQQMGAQGCLPSRLQTTALLLGMDVSGSTLLMYSSSTAFVYKTSSSGLAPELHSKFEVAPAADGVVPILALCNETIFRAAGNAVEACNLAGTVKQTITLEASQGTPTLLAANGDHLAAVTCNGLVRVFRASGREARSHAGPGPVLPEDLRPSLRVRLAALNATGSMLAALAVPAISGDARPAGAGDDSPADTRLFLYCSETNCCWQHDFAEDARRPVSLAWDTSDPRILAAQVQPAEPSTGGSRASSAGSTAGVAAHKARQQALAAAAAAGVGQQGHAGLEVAVLFASASKGLVLQEYQDCSNEQAHGLLALAAPHLLLSRHDSSLRAADACSPVLRVPLQGFAGVSATDPAVCRGLLDFAYHLALGAQEEAFRAVAALQSPDVWQTMAHAAIKSKRLDVAEHCLGNMQHVRGARALRQACADIPQLDARVGLVAVHLGLTDDAQRLFAAAQRWDLLTQLLAANGDWAGALEVAGKHDRLHLDALRYQYAQHLEACGDAAGALQQYMATSAGAAEVPRLLWRLGRLEELEAQVMRTGSAPLLTWWARYCESKGLLDQALASYKRAGNHLAVVRVHCAMGSWEAAEQVVASTGDAAAAFHLGRLYEAQERPTDALRCYAASKRFGAGVRLAQRYGMTQEVVGMAMQAPPAVQLEAADTLLGAGATAAAAQLYQAGGRPARALQLAAAAGHLDVLEGIAAALGAGGDPAVVARCADALLEAGHYDKAAGLLARVGQVARALDLLTAHELPLNEEMAEALTPAKDATSAEERQALLLRLAQLAKSQGLWSLAAKKYTQAGDRLAAMKMLVKAQDTDKVVFFAGVSRQPGVYLLAANYLQSLDWRASPELTKNIVGFYTKAGAFDSLARFYDACAARQVDEDKDYGKALQAYREAAKVLGKAKASPEVQQYMAQLTVKTDNCERFLTAKASVGNNPAACVSICQALLADAGMDAQVSTYGVDPGDVYALLVEWSYAQGNPGQAVQLLQQMCGRGLVPEHYLEPSTVAAVYQAVGMAPAKVAQQPRAAAGDSRANSGMLNPLEEGEVEEELPYIPG